MTSTGVNPAPDKIIFYQVRTYELEKFLETQNGS